MTRNTKLYTEVILALEQRIYVHAVLHRLASYACLNVRSTKYKHENSLDLDCFLDHVFNLHSV